MDPRSPLYYPPRARWHSPLQRVWWSVRRRLSLEDLREKAAALLGHPGLTWRRFFLSLLVPGYAFRVLGKPLIGLWILEGYLAALLVFLLLLGYPLANLAAGVMVSLHITSILFLPTSRIHFWHRLVHALLVMIAVLGLFYIPARGFLESHLALPMRVLREHGPLELVIVNPSSSMNGVRRGEWIAYRTEAGNRQGLVVLEGYGFDQALAVAGDRVVFTDQEVQVNGKGAPRLPTMPTGGELVVPEKCVMVWPRMSINNRGNIGQDAVLSQLIDLGVVTPERYVGKPYRRWFWRAQKWP